MSDRPTLWVHYDYGPDGEFSDRKATRADLLVALGDDLYWYCRRVNDWGIVGDCTSEKRRKDHPRCHWAVKP